MAIPLNAYAYRIIYKPLDKGGFQAVVPALPGIVTYGRTRKEAREMAEDAIVCHWKGLIKDNEYTLHERRMIDARLKKSLAEIKRGHMVGPFNTGDEMIAALKRELKKAPPKRRKGPRI